MRIPGPLLIECAIACKKRDDNGGIWEGGKIPDCILKVQEMFREDTDWKPSMTAVMYACGSEALTLLAMMYETHPVTIGDIVR